MKNLKISLKLLTGFGALLILMIGISWYARTGMKTVFTSADEAIGVIPTQNALVEIEYRTTRGHLWFEEYLAGDSSITMDDIMTEWYATIEYAAVLLDGGTKNNQTYRAVTDSTLREMLTNLRYALVDMVNLAEERRELYRTGRARAGSESDQMFDAAYERVIGYGERGKQIAAELINKSSKQTTETYDSTQFNHLIAAAVLVVMGLMISVVIARAIAGPVEEAASKIDREGINTQFSFNRNDEIGKLAKSVDTFLTSFRQILKEMSDASSAVSSASKEISVSTEAMARSAQDQMGQTASVTAAIEEMSKTSYEIAHNIGTAKEMAIHAQGSADKGTQVIDETVEGMGKMVSMVQQSSNVVNSLSESSRKITKVLSIIDDITKQVNLIALNASIEASRAGEKGKGFAVVADEIKKLAERTAHSTTEINDIIGKIQSNVNEAVTLMGRSSQEAGSGIKLAQEAKASLKEISDVFKNVTMMVSQVAVSSQEQSVTGDQITDNVKVINTATQQIATGIQQIARSAEYLNNLTTNLQKMMKRFKISA